MAPHLTGVELDLVTQAAAQGKDANDILALVSAGRRKSKTPPPKVWAIRRAIQGMTHKRGTAIAWTFLGRRMDEWTKSSYRLDIHGRRWIKQALAWIFMKDVGRRHGRRSISLVFVMNPVEDVAVQIN